MKLFQLIVGRENVFDRTKCLESTRQLLWPRRFNLLARIALPFGSPGNSRNFHHWMAHLLGFYASRGRPPLRCAITGFVSAFVSLLSRSILSVLETEPSTAAVLKGRRKKMVGYIPLKLSPSTDRDAFRPENIFRRFPRNLTTFVRLFGIQTAYTRTRIGLLIKSVDFSKIRMSWRLTLFLKNMLFFCVEFLFIFLCCTTNLSSTFLTAIYSSTTTQQNF